MSWNAAQEIHHAFILAPGQESMIPGFNHMLLCNRFDFGKIHDHAFISRASCGNDRAAEGYFYRVAMAVQMATLAEVIGNPVTGIEFEATRDAHGVQPSESRAQGSVRSDRQFQSLGFPAAPNNR